MEAEIKAKTAEYQRISEKGEDEEEDEGELAQKKINLLQGTNKIQHDYLKHQAGQINHLKKAGRDFTSDASLDTARYVSESMMLEGRSYLNNLMAKLNNAGKID